MPAELLQTQKHDIFTWENNMLSSHVKYHCCYGYIINHAFHSKQLFQWNGLVFRVEKIFHLFAALTCEISWLSTLKEKFCIVLSVQPCNILYISKISQSMILQKYQLFILLYYYMRNFCNVIGLEQWYFSLISNTYMWKLQTICG